jgi:hypothetical protein
MLSEMLFSLGIKTMLFGSNDIVFIDNSHEKSVCNEIGTSIFFQP